MSVQEAYAEVGRITRREAKNFAYGIMVLPRAKRQAIAAIYAFARKVDDVADGELPPAEKRARLEELRAALDADSADPVFVALQDARDRFAIPREPLEALIDGGLQDLEQSTYRDFEELRGYCEKVAGAVGLACIPVYGSDDTERALTHALELGIALQLINIIRDVDEDRRLGRVYLPQDEWWLNFFLGTMCRHAIISNTTFGWWIAWLNVSPGNRVVAPRRWHGPALEHFGTADLIPSRWITV